MQQPKYQKIEQDLLQKIKNETYPEGSLIPKEMELVDQYHVSRPTIRQAIQELVNQGYLEKKRKRGTLVKHNKIAQEFTHVIESYDQEMSQKGLATRTKVLIFQKEPANEDVQTALNLPAGAAVYKLVRLRFANDNPVVLVTSYLPVNGLKNFDQVDFTEQSLYAELAKQSHQITHVRRKLEVLAADETTSSLLNITTNSPIFYFHTYGSTAAGQAFEYSIANYRGDINYFVFDIDQQSKL